MRQESAASIKRKISLGLRLPREGSQLRVLYDRFMANKGKPIKIEKGGHINLPQLINYYGLDIRSAYSPGGRAGIPRRAAKGSFYILVGEWFGRVYIDYVAEQINKSEEGKK